jgi:hypothetical protein
MSSCGGSLDIRVVAKFKHMLGNPTWSQDGKKIVFAGADEDGLDDPGSYVMNADRANRTRLTDGSHRSDLSAVRVTLIDGTPEAAACPCGYFSTSCAAMHRLRPAHGHVPSARWP